VAARPKLTRADILDATLDLADNSGLAAVTMRAVADRLGVTPMALYRHVGDKQGLLDGLVERLLAEQPVPDAGLHWRDRLHQHGAALRSTARRHPEVFGLLLARRAVTPAARRTRDSVYQALRDAGISEAEVPRVERVLSTFVLGFAASEAGGRFPDRAVADADFAFAEQWFERLLPGGP
jgi:AcrR family transcriptional regulator